MKKTATATKLAFINKTKTSPILKQAVVAALLYITELRTQKINEWLKYIADGKKFCSD